MNKYLFILIVLKSTLLSSKLYANTENIIQCSIKPKERAKISNGAIPLDAPSISISKNNISTSEYLSILLKYALESLYKVDLDAEKISSALIKQHYIDTPDRDSNYISLLTIKKVVSELGYSGLSAYRVESGNTFQPPNMPEYKQIYLMIDYKSTYTLITDYNAEKIGVYYATGEYCSVPQIEFSTYFKPMITTIYRKIK